MQRYELTDGHWASIEPVLPPQRRTTRGGVWRDHRTVVNGIFWVLFSGAAWRDMPERYGPCKTAHDRFRRRQRNGTWERVLATVAPRGRRPRAARLRAVRRRLHQRPRHAGGRRGPKKNGPQALGMTRGGFGSKVHLMTDGGGLPIGCVLTQGNRNACPVFDELLDATLANAGGALPARLAADRGYGADRIRGKLSAMGVEPVIPYRRSEHVADRSPLNGRAYRGRNVVERCVGRLKEMRRIGTRYEKLASSYLAMLTLGMAVLYLRALT